MTQVSETKEKAAKGASKAAENGTFAAFEVPAAVREMAEKGVKQAKEAYDAYKTIAEEATDTLEDTFASVSKGTTELQTKALANARTHVDAGFDFFEKFIGVKSLAEVVELQTEFARKQFDALSEQTKEFQALAAKLQADSTKPFKDGMSKAMSQFKQAV